MKDKIVVDYLNQIHSKYGFVPIDKAANNTAIICKRFYIEKLLLEIRLLNTPSETYKLSAINDKLTIVLHLFLFIQVILMLEILIGGHAMQLTFTALTLRRLLPKIL